MDQRDLLFITESSVFGYRVAAVLIHNGKILLQHPAGDPAYALPGGHVHFGEVSEAALVRELQEEIAAVIQPERLLWIGENFFPWGSRHCHQICLYYRVSLCDETQIPLDGQFYARVEEGSESGAIEFCWVDLASLARLKIYPPQAKDLLLNPSDQIESFVYIQDEL